MSSSNIEEIAYAPSPPGYERDVFESPSMAGHAPTDLGDSSLPNTDESIESAWVDVPDARAILNGIKEDAISAVAHFEISAAAEGDDETVKELSERVEELVSTMNFKNDSVSPAELQWPVFLPTESCVRLISETAIPESGDWRYVVPQSARLDQLLTAMKSLQGPMEKRDEDLEALRKHHESQMDSAKQESMRQFLWERYVDSRNAIMEGWSTSSCVRNKIDAVTGWTYNLDPEYPWHSYRNPDEWAISDNEVRDLLDIADKFDPTNFSYNSKKPLKWETFEGTRNEAWHECKAKGMGKEAEYELYREWQKEQLMSWYSSFHKSLAKKKGRMPLDSEVQHDGNVENEDNRREGAASGSGISRGPSRGISIKF